MVKLFISYRSLDSAKVDTIVARLRDLKQSDGTPLYDIWQDKTSIIPGEDWWRAIVSGIDGSQIFVYMISRESAQNVNCRAELSYARRRNRAILPLVLEGEFGYNPVTGKRDIDYWGLIPAELNDLRAQFLFYEGTASYPEFNRACAEFARRGFRDIHADFPPDPRHAGDATNDTGVIYDQACDAAYRLDLATAERWFQRLVDWNDRLFGEDARDWIELLRRYERMARLAERMTTRYQVAGLWLEYTKLYPKRFIEGIFDPADLQRLIDGKTQPQSKPKTLTVAEAAVAVRVILGDPFDWCEIPAGEFLYGENKQKLTLPTFWMAKYPVTYSQFQVFIDAKDGFYDDRWWQGLGADADHRQQPREQRWKSANHPRENVSWYDSVAFCRWLAFRLYGESGTDPAADWTIRLPTEVEWEKAARGTKGLIYPYGDTFDKAKGNTSESGIDKTTPVTQYPPGVSPYGVLDLSGNVWEWCRNDYRNPDLLDNYNNSASKELRGGSFTRDLNAAVTSSRGVSHPKTWSYSFGFRVVCAAPVRPSAL